MSIEQQQFERKKEEMNFQDTLLKIWEWQDSNGDMSYLELKSEFEKGLRKKMRKNDPVEIKINFPGQIRMKYLKALNDKWKPSGLEIIVVATEDEKMSAPNEFASGIQWEKLGEEKLEQGYSTESIEFLGKNVEVKMDRQLGTRHPKYGFMYMLNYGFIPGTKSSNDEELDAYILGEFEPVETFSGKCIAVIRRINDDDKLIVVPEGKEYTDEQIRALTEF